MPKILCDLRKRSYVQPEISQRRGKLFKTSVQQPHTGRRELHLTGTANVSDLPGAVSACLEMRKKVIG